MTGSLLNGWANHSLYAAWHWLNVLLLYQFSSIWKPWTAAVCYFSRTTLNVPWQGLPMLYTVSHAIRNQNQNQNQWACDYLSMQSLNLTMLVYQLVYTLGNLTCKFAHECHCPPVSLFSCTVTHECMLSIKWSSWTRALYVTIIWGFDIFSKYGLHRTTGLCVSTTISVPKTRNRHCSMQIHKNIYQFESGGPIWQRPGFKWEANNFVALKCVTRGIAATFIMQMCSSMPSHVT